MDEPHGIELGSPEGSSRRGDGGPTISPTRSTKPKRVTTGSNKQARAKHRQKAIFSQLPPELLLWGEVGAGPIGIFP